MIAGHSLIFLGILLIGAFFCYIKATALLFFSKICSIEILAREDFFSWICFVQRKIFTIGTLAKSAKQLPRLRRSCWIRWWKKGTNVFGKIKVFVVVPKMFCIWSANYLFLCVRPFCRQIFAPPRQPIIRRAHDVDLKSESFGISS